MPYDDPLRFKYTLVDDLRFQMFKDAEGSGPGRVINLLDEARPLGVHEFPGLRRLTGEVVIGHENFRANMADDWEDGRTVGRLELPTVPLITGPANYQRKEPKKRKDRRRAAALASASASASVSAASGGATSGGRHWVMVLSNQNPTVNMCVTVEVAPPGQTPFSPVSDGFAVLVPARHTVILPAGERPFILGTILRSDWYPVRTLIREVQGQRTPELRPDLATAFWHAEMELVRPGTFASRPAAPPIGSGDQAAATSQEATEEGEIVEESVPHEGVGLGGE